MIRAMLNPDLYHAHGKKNGYFEGWYFKRTNPAGEAFAFIPGILLSDKQDHAHSFIQVVDGNQATLAYIKYPVEAFKASKKRFEIQIGHNHFHSEVFMGF